MRTAISVLGVDIGKNVCSLVGLDALGKVVLRRRVKRETLVALAAKLPPCIVAMEACCGAHHLGRVFAARGHEVRLMSPEYVRPYVKAQKNDDRDAEGIAEAATRPTMRFVELKAQAQLDLQTLHRARDRLVGERTALINQLRAILLERGIVVAKGKRNLEKFLASLLDGPDDHGLTERMRTLIADMRAQWTELDRRIRVFSQEGDELRVDDPRSRPADRFCVDRGDRRGRDVRKRARSCGMAGVDTAPGDDRRQAEAARDQQARQPISAQDADPWGARSAAACR
jgi:transposase